VYYNLGIKEEKDRKMKTLTIQETQRILEELGALYAHTTEDIVHKKHDLAVMLMNDERLDLDEICDYASSYMTFSFRMVKKGGRTDRETGSRKGVIKQALLVEFSWRTFADGGYQTTVEIGF